MFRKLLCEVEELQGIKEVNSKKIESFKKKILEADEDKEMLKGVFEDLFFEVVEDALIEVFIDKCRCLNQKDKESYIDAMLNTYKEYGEFGFVTVALNSFK